MPFTHVTLINGSDNDADAHVHINTTVGAETWVVLQAQPNQTTVQNQPSGHINQVLAQDPTGGNFTRVILADGSNPGELTLKGNPPDIDVGDDEIVSVTIVVHPNGQGLLTANVIPVGTNALTTQSRALA